MRKLLNFLRENKDYQVLVGTDRAQETQQVIDRVCEHDIAAKECFNRAKICHVNDWMPKDDEKIGDITGAEIRAVVETMRRSFTDTGTGT